MIQNHEFSSMYEKYRPLVLKVSYSYTKEWALAEDITQETFLALYRDMGRRIHRNVKWWLYTTAKNRALNCRRRKLLEARCLKKLQMLQGDRALCKSAEESCMEQLTRESCRQFLGQIFRQLRKKNARWYEVMDLVYRQESALGPTAEQVHMSRASLCAMLFRARKWVKTYYREYYDDIRR